MTYHEHETQKASIVVFSGDMDKVMAAFIIATTAAASGIETSMFFTFWGLQAIKKPVSTGKTLFQKMLSLFFKDIDRIGPSKLNMGGLGRWMFKKMMKQQNVTTLPELRQMAIDLGVKLLACQMSMDVMGIRREDLIDEVTDVVGAATYIAEANQSHITLFI
ncbi:MAG: DsrE/DsrF/DrsH-like family protein [Anaerolineae bacterium]|nr:DsrE/DsrF/DrsH-like family protein [Anaerolineae bacterium]MCX8067033.1 DsrE/DsrF/DrsH-like family protein [Anaerolineae bacterium]MDW7990615.1 DsrE/DsrF/DrsH-like family protein [Anaerolineae bacterium]